MYLIKFKNGFTLAETLITLGIIGIVAAMTIPNMINAYKAKQLRTRFNKAYSIIQQAARQINANDLSLDILFGGKGTGGRYNKLLPYLSGATDCGYYYKEKCLNIREYTGMSTGGLDDGQIMLSDGTLITFERSGAIAVDINGSNKPNLVGYDLFLFQAIDEEFVPYGAPQTWYNNSKYPCNYNFSWNGSIGCAYRAVNDPDYFKNLVKKYKP